MRMQALALVIVLAPGLAGCAVWPSPIPPGLEQTLQAEGSHPMQVPLYLMGKDGTFTTNGLTPLPWGDTH